MVQGERRRLAKVREDGLVHYCSQQRGRPGIPLDDYTIEDLKREAARPKGCAPFCTISCVHQTAMLDSFREIAQRGEHPIKQQNRKNEGAGGVTERIVRADAFARNTKRTVHIGRQLLVEDDGDPCIHEAGRRRKALDQSPYVVLQHDAQL